MNHHPLFRQTVSISAAVLALSLSACSKSPDPAGSGTSVPSISEVVEGALPTSLKVVTANNLLRSSNDFSPRALPTCTNGQADSGNLQDEVYCRLFAVGPIQVLSLTESADDRLASLGESAVPGTSSCLDSLTEITTFSFPSPLNATAFGTAKYNCKDQLTDTTYAAFGKEASSDGTSTIWWVQESGQSSTQFDNSQSNTWVMTANEAGEVQTAEGYVVISPDVGACSNPAICTGTTIQASTMVLHALADKAAATVEMAVTGDNIGFCAVHLKASATQIYIHAQPGSGDGNCGAAQELCLSAETYTTDPAGCAALKASTQLSVLNRSAWSSAANGGPTNAVGASSLPGTSTTVNFWEFVNLAPTTLADVPSVN